MSSTDQNQTYIIVLNAVIAGFYIALSATASHFMLLRDDAARRARLAATHYSLRWKQQQQQPLAVSVASGLLHSSDASSRGSAVSGRFRALSARSSAISDPVPEAPSLRHHFLEDVEENASLWDRLTRTDAPTLNDARTIFFFTVIVSGLTSATTVLIFSYATGRNVTNTSGNRKTQDLISAPAGCAIVIVWASLLLALHSIFEHDVARATVDSKTRWRFFAIVATAVSISSVAMVLQFFDIFSHGIEWATATMEFCVGACAVVLAYRLPQQILHYGEELAVVAVKVRRVSLLVALCLAARFALLFPLAQSSYSSFGELALLLFEAIGLLPVFLMLFFVHQPAR